MTEGCIHASQFDGSDCFPNSLIVDGEAFPQEVPMDVCRPQPGVGPEQGANGVDQRVIGDVLADELAGPDEVLGVRRQKAQRDGVAAPVAPAPAADPEEIPSLWCVAEQKLEGGWKMGARQGEPEAELLGGMRDVEPRQHLAEGGQ
jgi:hypothetical protein